MMKWKILAIFLACWAVAFAQMPSPVMFYNSRGTATASSWANTYSLSFAKASAQSLAMEKADFGWSTINTTQAWLTCFFKTPTNDNTTKSIFAVGDPYFTNGSIKAYLAYGSANNQLVVDVYTNGVNQSCRLVTTAGYTDGNWHFVRWQWDTTQATAANRTTLFVDGAQVSSFLVAQYPVQYSTLWTNSANPNGTKVVIGASGNAGSDYWPGNLDELHFGNGVSSSDSSFRDGSGHAVDTTGMSGMLSWVRGDTTATNDEVLVTRWTNNNGVSQDANAP